MAFCWKYVQCVHVGNNYARKKFKKLFLLKYLLFGRGVRTSMKQKKSSKGF